MNLINRVISLFKKNDEEQQSERLETNLHNDNKTNNSSHLDSSAEEKRSNHRELNPVEILMLNYANKRTVGDSSFPGYWHYQYNSEPKELIERLLSLDLLKIDSTLPNNMKDYLVKDLKKLLREKELKVSGNKDELIERLLNNVPKEELEIIFNQKKYLLTVKGNEILALNDHIRFFHSYGRLGISIYRAQAIKKENPEFNKFDIAHKQLEHSSTRNLNNSDWGLYRNDRYSVSVILELENKLIDSLEVLFEVCYYDLSGVGNNFNLDFINIYEEYFFPYENSHHTVAPGIIGRMQDLQDRLAISREEFLDIGLRHIEKIETPIHLFTHHEVLEIVANEMVGDIERVKRIYKTAEERYLKSRTQYILNKIDTE